MLKALHECRKANCKELTRDTYCDNHKQEASKDINSKYDKYNRNKKAKEFYHSKEWFKARGHRLKQDFGLCVRCREQGRLTKADVVHHRIELMKAWDKRTDNDNLESLCHACHNEHHKKG